MILSVSRRTDVPSMYSDWFFEVLKAGQVLVPNPFFEGGKTAKVLLEPVKIHTNILGGVEIFGNLEAIVFWTKNPIPMLNRLAEIPVPYYFQYTLNPYGTQYETNLPPLERRVEAFVELAKHCPVVWRYDPIFLSNSITADWHFENFEKLAQKLSGSTKICTINTLIGKFTTKNSQKTATALQLNMASVAHNIHGTTSCQNSTSLHHSNCSTSTSTQQTNSNTETIYCPNPTQTFLIVTELNKIAKKYGIELRTCAELSSMLSKESNFSNSMSFEKNNAASASIENSSDINSATPKHFDSTSVANKTHHSIENECSDNSNNSLEIPRAKCVDPEILQQIVGFELKPTKLTSPFRTHCHCAQSIDIGTYNTCKNGCIYCYAQKPKAKIASSIMQPTNGTNAPSISQTPINNQSKASAISTPTSQNQQDQISANSPSKAVTTNSPSAVSPETYLRKTDLAFDYNKPLEIQHN